LNNSTKKRRTSEKLEDWISQAEAARIRGVSQQAIKNLISRERLESLTIGGKILVKRSEVESFQPRPTGRPRKGIVKKLIKRKSQEEDTK
jgi:excisionase family DNA binding protein